MEQYFNNNFFIKIDGKPVSYATLLFWFNCNHRIPMTCKEIAITQFVDGVYNLCVDSARVYKFRKYGSTFEVRVK